MRTIALTTCFVLAMMIAQQACAQQPCPTLVVSNTNDIVNGDTSSPCALIANPGPDGISLREAVEAADNATGAGTVTVTFAASLAGQTIAPSNAVCCYNITRSGIAISGITDANGEPTVTIDGSNMFLFFHVMASDVAITSLHFVGFETPNPLGTQTGIFVGPDASGPSFVGNVLIQGNAFSNSPNTNTGIAVVIGMNPQTTGAVVSNVTVANNTFTYFSPNGAGVPVWAWGTNDTLEDLLIFGNIFTDVWDPLELSSNYGSGNSILGARIIGNTFVGNPQNEITMNHYGVDGQPQPNSNNLVDSTVIERNVFESSNRGVAVNITGGRTEPTGSTVSVVGNAITNTLIANNLVTGNTQYGAVAIAGGDQGSTQNTVSGVTVVNNTFANISNTVGTMTLDQNIGGATGNTVADVAVLNTIFWNNQSPDLLGFTSNQVHNLIVTQPGFAGVNGNIASNPLFVNPSNNFALQSGSPARHAGTLMQPGCRAALSSFNRLTCPRIAPTDDIDCQPRGSPPSIGAYEFRGPNICNSPPLPAAELRLGR